MTSLIASENHETTSTLAPFSGVRDEGVAPAKKIRKRKRKKKAPSEAPPSSETLEPDQLRPSTTEEELFIEGLPYSMTQDEVTSFLTDAGFPPTSLRLPTFQDTGNLRGFGHVVFASKAMAEKGEGGTGGLRECALSLNRRRCVTILLLVTFFGDNAKAQF